MKAINVLAFVLFSTCIVTIASEDKKTIYIKLNANHTVTGTCFIPFGAADIEGNIGTTRDGYGIKFHVAGIYLVGYNLAIAAVNDFGHGWIELGDGTRLQSFGSSSKDTVIAYKIIGGSVPIRVVAGSEIRFFLYSGTLIMDGNPHTFWAVKQS